MLPIMAVNLYYSIYRQQSAPAASNSSTGGTTPEQLAQLRALVGSMTGGTSEAGLYIFKSQHSAFANTFQISFL